jgi:hypothetical protein
MNNLKEIIKDTKISSEVKLRKYIDQNYSNTKKLPLKIIKRKEINADNENRIFNKELIFKNVLFDIEELNILNSKKVSFQDCIFTGSLRISNKDTDIATEIFLDTVVIKDNLNISGAFNISKCSLSSVNCVELNILNNDTISQFSLSSCNICLMMMFNNAINTFDTFFNKISHIEISHSSFSNVTFPHNQININNQTLLLSSKKKEKLKKSFNVFSFGEVLDFEELGNIEKMKIANDTTSFLLRHSDYHLNKRDRSKIKYISGLSSIPQKYMRFLYHLYGGLLKPYRIVLLMLLSIMVFSIIFYFSEANFIINSVEQPLSFTEALYFSGISFTTIGYGDISPIGFIRYIAIMEGLIGVILSGAFLVSLTRKYIE